MAASLDLTAYKDAMILLGTAGVVVPLVHRYKVSPILGFLLAGVLLGPHGLGAHTDTLPLLRWISIADEKSVARLAEFGVVFLLFLIGLELSWPRLMTMRRLVFGLGSLQVAVSALMIGAAATMLGLRAVPAVVVGMALALSSTAIVIELLAARHRLQSTTGRAAFAVLLAQDLAVVPILFLVGILGAEKDGSVLRSLVSALLQGAAAIALIVLLGRVVLRPLLRAVAATRSHELFIAATLFVVAAASLLAGAAGLSMALGAFVAGLLLAETEFRRAVEATIEPFKALLLGMFFFSVGMSLNLSELMARPASLAGAALLLIGAKAVLAALAARAFRLSWPVAAEVGLLLGPGGEFAFVVLGLAMTYGILDPATGSFTLAVVSLSMLLLPACSRLGRSTARRLSPPVAVDPELAVQPPLDGEVEAIVVGHGRVGALVGDMLGRHGINHLATDRDPVVVGKWRRLGRPVYFGDARQPLFLERCGIARAKAVIITIHTHPEIDGIVEVVKRLRPDIVIVSRARDAQHAIHLYEVGVTDAVPETIEASLQLSEAALVGLGVAAGPVIASIHEKRDEFRRELQGAGTGEPGRQARAVRQSERS